MAQAGCSLHQVRRLQFCHLRLQLCLYRRTASSSARPMRVLVFVQRGGRTPSTCCLLPPLPCSHSSGGGGGPPAPMAWSCHLPAVPSAASLASPDGAVSVPSVLHPAAAVSPEKASQSASVSPEKTSLSLMQYTQWLNDRADLSTSEGFAFPLRSAAVCPIPLSP